MRYAELHVKTNYSFLVGASHPEELVTRAAALGYEALAITDRHSLGGVVRAHVAAREAGLKLIVGAEIAPGDAPPVVLLAIDRQGYGQLTRLITRGRLRAPKGDCRLVLDDIACFHRGLIGCVVPRAARGRLAEALNTYREIFGDRGYLLAPLLCGSDDARQMERWQRLGSKAGLPLIAAGEVHYHTASRQALQHVLTAVRHGTTVMASGHRLFSNAQRHLRPMREIAARYARWPELVDRTVEIAARCHFTLDLLRYSYPQELAPAGQTPAEYLARLAWQGARARYPRGVPPKVRQLLEHELALIAELRYEAYFLTIWDLVRFARRRGILCQGRGSAANSAVCYALGITAVDPERLDVLFERFISRQRREAPDIDVDFEHERREEVLQYLYAKYGRQRAAMTAEIIRYRPRSAVRDVGKALGFSLDGVDQLAKNLENYHDAEELPARCAEVGFDPRAPLIRRWLRLVEQLIGFPRHRSQHVGGMVISREPLCEMVPIENAAMPGRTVIEWDKNDLEALGLLKVDCLALGMLTAIRKCFSLVRQHRGRELMLANVPAEDPRVYDMICRADTIGVFQIESRAQMSMLPRLKPRTWYDLVIEVAIVRPGPIQGEMVHPYLRRRSGEEPVDYPNRAVRQVLEKTLGVPLFQEQVMRLAMVAAGFDAGEADQLRRAMGAWRRPGLIHRFRQRLLEGMQAQGFSRAYAERIFQQIQGFGEYGFPESHAASFALLVYVSAWLKYHEPAAFTAALLNSQPMGFYAPAQLIADARRHGVEVRPVDVNHSHWDCTLEPAGDEGAALALRLGLRLVSGLPRAAAEPIERARRPFASWSDLVRQTQLPRAALRRLAEADALRSLGLDRRRAVWQTMAQERRPASRPLLERLEDECGDEAMRFELPRAAAQQEVLDDYRCMGLSLRAHPLAFYRQWLDSQGVLPAAALATCPTEPPVRVAGLVLLRQRPGTASGITFVTLEDETGTINLIIRPAIWNRYATIARHATLWLAEGQLQRQHQTIHLIAQTLHDLTSLLPHLQTTPRNFR